MLFTSCVRPEQPGREWMGSPRPPKPPGCWVAERREREASPRFPSCQPQEVTELDKEDLVPALAPCSASWRENSACSHSVVLTLECTSGSPGELIHTHFWVPPHRCGSSRRGLGIDIPNKLPGDAVLPAHIHTVRTSDLHSPGFLMVPPSFPVCLSCTH